MVNSRALRKMKTEIAELKNGMAQKDEEIAKLKEENREMKRKIERIQTYFPKTKQVRALPAELLNELFASLSLENAFDILAKMPNGLLGRNVRKMLKGIEMAMRNNKWNEADCGPKMTISGRGLVVKHSGPDTTNSVRAQLANPKFNLSANKSAIAYFEVEVIVQNHPNLGDIDIGFCTQQIPLEGNGLGFEQNSIGIWHKGGMWIGGKENRFGNECGLFQAGEVIGIGIAHFPANSSMKCFASCNGQLLGKVNLAIKFADLQLFPGVTMYHANDSIRANFGRDPWQYNPVPILFAN